MPTIEYFAWVCSVKSFGQAFQCGKFESLLWRKISPSIIAKPFALHAMGQALSWF
jgi:hypothetical protein